LSVRPLKRSLREFKRELAKAPFFVTSLDFIKYLSYGYWAILEDSMSKQLIIENRVITGREYKIWKKWLPVSLDTNLSISLPGPFNEVKIFSIPEYPVRVILTNAERTEYALIALSGDDRLLARWVAEPPAKEYKEIFEHFRLKHVALMGELQRKVNIGTGFFAFFSLLTVLALAAAFLHGENFSVLGTFLFVVTVVITVLGHRVNKDLATTQEEYREMFTAGMMG
jgi:hypothetical protein